MFFRIGLANIRRHGRRSALILLAVAVSVIVMEFMAGLVAGMRADFFTNLLNDNGHVRVRSAAVADALNPFALDLLLADPDSVIEAAEAHPDVADAESILTFGALAVAGDKNSPMIGYGVDLDTGYFTDVRDGLVAGSFLRRPGEILVSESTAMLFAIGLGDPVVLLVEDSTGAPYYLEYTISGLFRSKSGQFDDTAFLVSMNDARELLYVENSVREVRVRLHDPVTADTVAAHLRSALPTAGAPGRHEVETWEQINGSMVIVLEMFDVFMYIINVIIVIVAATVITNAILMNVFEKIREFGMMRAIGLTRRGQFRLIMVEGLSYGVVGSAVGIVFGIGLVLYFQSHGISVGEVTESLGMGRDITTAFVPGDAIVSALFGMLVAVAGSLYAGLVATRMDLIDTLRESA